MQLVTSPSTSGSAEPSASEKMRFNGVITHNVVPMRAEPAGGSEQVSQAVWGDNVRRLAEQDEWVRIRMADGYEGWVWHQHVRPFDPDVTEEEQAWPFGQIVGQAAYIATDFALLTDVPDSAALSLSKLVFGTWVQVPLSTRRDYPTETLVQLPIGWQAEDAQRVLAAYISPNTALCVAAEETASAPAGAGQRYPQEFDGNVACALACRFIGTPYLWGGTTPFGFDCSGFVQRIYSTLNIVLPRDAYMQAESPLGTRLPVPTPMQAADLVFFAGRSDPRKRGITHVGMALDANRFIHAVGKEGVVITPFDDPYYSLHHVHVGSWRYAAPPVS